MTRPTSTATVGGPCVTLREFRRDLAQPALSTPADWAQNELHVQRLELYVEPWNEGSWRAAEATGFAREGLMRQW